MMLWLLERYQVWRYTRWVRTHPAVVRALALHCADFCAYKMTAAEMAHTLAQLHRREVHD